MKNAACQSSPFAEILARIAGREKAFPPNGIVRDEWAAIVSHWVQSPATPPLFLDRQKAREWRAWLKKGGLTQPADFSALPFPPPAKPRFTFIDLFAGVGGFRIALQGLGGKCVFSSEWNKPAQKTYFDNFGETPFGDITRIPAEAVPDHDILCGGFPCQAFSIAGKKGGFADSRGTLFFEIARILKAKQPAAFFLENVKGLMSHRGGRTLAAILAILRDELGYFVPDPQIVRAEDFGVPQKRGRVYIVGFHPRTGVRAFAYPRPLSRKAALRDIKETNVSARYYLSTVYLNSLRRHRARHESLGNGFGFEIVPDDAVANTIVIGGMGRERNLVVDGGPADYTPVTHIRGEINREGIRRMTPREWARLQGFPDAFRVHRSDAQAYRQFGNSVAVPAIRATAERLLAALRKR